MGKPVDIKHKQSQMFTKWLKQVAPDMLKTDSKERARLADLNAIEGSLDQIDYALAELPLTQDDRLLAQQLKERLLLDKQEGIHAKLHGKELMTWQRSFVVRRK